MENIDIMDAKSYDTWSNYYDPDNKELTEINYVLQKYFAIKNPWSDMNVLEVGCGTGRFTKRIINSVRHIDAIEPDEKRCELLKEYLQTHNLQRKCTVHIETLYDFLKKRDNKIKYDLIIFSWSWAYISDDEREESIIGTLDVLNNDGVVISTMVEGGYYEEICYDICKNHNPEYCNTLKKNATANEVLRKILLDKSVFVSETMICSEFQFNDYNTMKNVVFLSLPEKENISKEEVENYFFKHTIEINGSGKYMLSDIVRCIVFQKIPKEKKKAKITFNYKLCDNRGDCSAAKECRKYRSAIIRVKNSEQTLDDTKRWGVMLDRCDPDLCGKKCETVCELFSVFRFWPEVFESLRQIENTAIEQDFFDKDRYGSGSFNPEHRTKELSVALSCMDESKPLQILEISDERRHASSFDSVLITDIISKTYYDRYYTKYDIPKIEEENPEWVTLYEDDHKYDDIYEKVLNSFQLDELPALLIISYGKIVFKYEGLLRSVDIDVVRMLKEKVAEKLSELSEVIGYVK